MTTKGQNIYFIRPVGMVGPIKIGCSTHVDERLSALSTWSPFKLEVIYTEKGDYKLEQQIHQCFADYHSHREWFHPGQRLLEAVGKLLSGQTIETAIDFTQNHGPIRNVQRSPRKPVPEFRKELLSYKSRVRWAPEHARKITGEPMWVPNKIAAILRRWEGTWPQRRQDAVRPTVEEFAMLDEFLACPQNHCLTRSQMFPAPVAVKGAAA